MELRKVGETRSNGRQAGTVCGPTIGSDSIGSDPRDASLANDVPAKLRVMLVDGYASSREALAFVIERQRGMMVVAQAGTLQGACSALSRISPSPDVVVVDPELPDGEGADLLHQLRAFRCAAAVLVLSTHPESASVARTVLAGALGVMHRSAGLNDVVDAMRRLGRGKALLSSADIHGFSRVVARQHEEERDERVRFCRLTKREKEILGALTRGLSDKQISEELYIAEGTVRQHVAKLLAKLEVPSRLRAALFGLRNGIL